VQATLQALEETAKRAFRSDPSSSNDEASGMLALLNVAGSLQACVGNLEALLRSHLLHLSDLLQPQSGQHRQFSLVHIRLNKAEVSCCTFGDSHRATWLLNEALFPHPALQHVRQSCDGHCLAFAGEP
jgi:hypothetical protein